MDYKPTRVWKRRKSHHESNDDEAQSLGPVTVTCPKCGSVDVRASNTPEFSFVVSIKGGLYRCRICKSHFRIRGINADFTGVMWRTAGAAITLVFFIVGVTQWDQIRWRFEKLLSAPSPADQALQKDQAKESSAQKGDGLTDQVTELNNSANQYRDQFPAVERAYRDMASDYKILVDRENQVPATSAHGSLAERLRNLSTDTAQTLEAGHNMLVNYVSDFRHQSASGTLLVARRLQECREARYEAMSHERLLCDRLAEALRALSANSVMLEKDFSASEEIYRQTCRELNQISMKSIGVPIIIN